MRGAGGDGAGQAAGAEAGEQLRRGEPSDEAEGQRGNGRGRAIRPGRGTGGCGQERQGAGELGPVHDGGISDGEERGGAAGRGRGERGERATGGPGARRPQAGRAVTAAT